MEKIAYITLSDEDLSKIQNDLDKEWEEFSQQENQLILKQKFLAASMIYRNLKKNCESILINCAFYPYCEELNGEINFSGCFFMYENKKKLDKKIENILSSYVNLFAQDIEDNLLDKEIVENNIAFINDSIGRLSFLKKIMGEKNYILWNKCHLEQSLPDNSYKSISKKI